MRVDAWGSEPHYRAAVRPVYDALPDSVRGTFGPDGDGDATVVASYNDLRYAASRYAGVVFMEHGIGQTYGEGLASYAGSPRRDRVVAFLEPNAYVRAANRRALPGIPGRIVGTPRMDPFWALEAPATTGVGLAWHWDAAVVPEARTALYEYAEAVVGLAHRFNVIGTAHPRIRPIAAAIYAAAGIPFVEAEEMYRRASVLVADNTTLGWDFVGLDRPVVLANARAYRRHVDHGLRFWDAADSGYVVDDPDDLRDAVAAALNDDDLTIRARRRAVGRYLYPYRDGGSARRAASAVLELLGR